MRVYHHWWSRDVNILPLLIAEPITCHWNLLNTYCTVVICVFILLEMYMCHLMICLFILLSNSFYCNFAKTMPIIMRMRHWHLLSLMLFKPKLPVCNLLVVWKTVWVNEKVIQWLWILCWSFTNFHQSSFTNFIKTTYTIYISWSVSNSAVLLCRVLLSVIFFALSLMAFSLMAFHFFRSVETWRACKRHK